MSVRQSAWAVYDIFELNSGERLFVGIVSDTLWQRFCEEFGLTDWAADVTLASNAGRVSARDNLLPAIGQGYPSPPSTHPATCLMTRT